MNPEPHPDLLLQQAQVKQITRGSRQYADDKAMEAYWQAIEQGKTVDEAGEVFIKCYIKNVRDGK